MLQTTTSALASIGVRILVLAAVVAGCTDDADGGVADAGSGDAGIIENSDAGVDPFAAAIDIALPFTTTLSVVPGERACFRFELTDAAVLAAASSLSIFPDNGDGCRPPLALALYDGDASDGDAPIAADTDDFCRHELSVDVAAGAYLVCASAAEPLSDVPLRIEAFSTCGEVCGESDRGGVVTCERGAVNRVVDTAGCAAPNPPEPASASGCTAHDECDPGSFCIRVAGDIAQNACVAPCAADTDCRAGELCLCEDESAANGALARVVPTCVPFTCRTGADCEGAPCGLGRRDACDQSAGVLACRSAQDTCGLPCGACVASSDGWSAPPGGTCD